MAAVSHRLWRERERERESERAKRTQLCSVLSGTEQQLVAVMGEYFIRRTALPELVQGGKQSYSERFNALLCSNRSPGDYFIKNYKQLVSQNLN